MERKGVSAALVRTECRIGFVSCSPSTLDIGELGGSGYKVGLGKLPLENFVPGWSFSLDALVDRSHPIRGQRQGNFPLSERRDHERRKASKRVEYYQEKCLS